VAYKYLVDRGEKECRRNDDIFYYFAIEKAIEFIPVVIGQAIFWFAPYGIRQFKLQWYRTNKTKKEDETLELLGNDQQKSYNEVPSIF
jgi:hypothetical protein